MRARHAGAVVASEIVIIPDIDKGHMPVELGLLRRSEHTVVSGAESGPQIRRDVQVVKVTGVHVEQRLVLEDSIEDGVRAARARARGERDGEGSGSIREGAKLAALETVQATIEFERVMVTSVWLQIRERESDDVAFVCGGSHPA